MSLRRVLLIAFLTAVLVEAPGVQLAAVAAPTLNYQGRVTVTGSSYSGMGYFKFVLHNGWQGLWSNDGSSGMGEPSGSVTLNVNNGLFSVELGNGMTPISPLAFHEHTVWLRTWFSSSPGGGFQQLSPDVALSPLDHAHFNTGDMLVVDDDGTADFQDPQEAVNVAATNWDYRAVLIMPGWYQLGAPLRVPGDEWVAIRGMGQEWTTLANTNGATLVAFNGRIEDIRLEGAPAIDDTTAVSNYHFRASRCDFRSQEYTLSETVILAQDGGEESSPSVDFQDCSFNNWEGTNTLRLAGNVHVNAHRTQFECEGADTVLLGGGARLDAVDCQFSSWNGEGTPLVMRDTGYDASLWLNQCRVWHEGNVSMALQDALGNVEARDTMMDAEVRVVGGFVHTRFRDCQTGAMLFENGGGGIDIEECSISGGGFTNALRMANWSWGAWVRNSMLHSMYYPAVSVENPGQELYIKESEIHTDSATTIELVFTPDYPGHWAGLRLWNCRVLNYGSPTNGGDCVRFANGATNDDANLWLDITDCDLNGRRNGIDITGPNAEAMVRRSRIWGNAFGAMCTGDCEVEFEYCHVAGETGAVVNVGAWVDLDYTSAEGEQFGVFASNGWTLAEYSTVEADGVGMLSYGGMACMGMHSQFSGEIAACSLIGPVPMALFQDCTFLGWSTNATSAVIGLAAGAETNAPIPELYGCTIRSLGSGTSIDLSGAATGGVRMAHCVLSSAIHSNLTLMAPSPVAMPYGNLVMPAPESWKIVLEED